MTIVTHYDETTMLYEESTVLYDKTTNSLTKLTSFAKKMTMFCGEIISLYDVSDKVFDEIVTLFVEHTLICD